MRRCANRGGAKLIYRQRLIPRITHRVWAICLLFQRLTGLQIFNAHPALEIGDQSGLGFDNAVVTITARETDAGLQDVTTLFDRTSAPPVILGASRREARAFFARVEQATMLLQRALSRGASALDHSQADIRQGQRSNGSAAPNRDAHLALQASGFAVAPPDHPAGQRRELELLCEMKGVPLGAALTADEPKLPARHALLRCD